MPFPRAAAPFRRRQWSSRSASVVRHGPVRGQGSGIGYYGLLLGYFPHCLMFVDGKSGLTLKFDMLSPAMYPRELLMSVVTPLLEMGVMPAEIRLSDRLLYNILSAEFENLNTSVGLYESLPQAENAFESIFSRFASGPQVVAGESPGQDYRPST